MKPKRRPLMSKMRSRPKKKRGRRKRMITLLLRKRSS
jgi:hypothetical protein